MLFFFFFNDTATTEIYTLSLHDALPIYPTGEHRVHPGPEGPRRNGVLRRARRQRRGPSGPENGRAHLWNPVTSASRIASSSFKKKKIPVSHRIALALSLAIAAVASVLRT